jgi:hypothetical protein
MMPTVQKSLAAVIMLTSLFDYLKNFSTINSFTHEVTNRLSQPLALDPRKYRSLVPDRLSQNGKSLKGNDSQYLSLDNALLAMSAIGIYT